MTVVQLLEAAKEKINTPEKWCKRANARDANGTEVKALSPNACQWCIDGALMSANGSDHGPYWDAYYAIGTAIGCGPLRFNDRLATTHADVMEAFGKAIELKKKEAAHAPT
jgi:hypothetical protein